MTGTERKRTWRAKQAAQGVAQQPPKGTPEKRLNATANLADIVKIIRTDLRTKHSLAADNEIRDLLPKVTEAFWFAVHTGHCYEPTPDHIQKLLEFARAGVRGPAAWSGKDAVRVSSTIKAAKGMR